MTTLMEEEPYAAVVSTRAISLTCAKCFDWNNTNLERVKLNRCAGCKVFYYCSAKCQKEDWKNHKAECKLLPSADFVPSETARLVMRMIEKSKKQPDFKSFNGRTYNSLMHHYDERLQNFNRVTEARTVYAEIFRFMGSAAPDFATVFIALSKKVINAFQIRDGSWSCDPCGIGIYLGLSVLDHSCSPDAFVVNQGSKMMLRTTKKDLVYSDKLTISYFSEDFFMKPVMRRAHLLDTYCFFCKCEMCEDVEWEKKRFSGRPACCPNSWFHIPDRICNNCSKEVSSELAAKADDATKRLLNAFILFTEREAGGCGATVPLIPEFRKVFDSCKEVVSDENAYLIAIAKIIYFTSPLAEINLSEKYGDLCILQARKSPHCLDNAILFSRRVKFYGILKKPLQERKEALKEALDSAQVAFGSEHDFTLSLVGKMIVLGFANLNTD